MALSAVSHLQVSTQLIGVALAIYPWQTQERGPLAALAACVVGAVLGVWTLRHNRIGNFSIFPEPRHTAHLVTSGPYAFIRHPMYSALMLMMVGIATWNTHIINTAGCALVVVAVIGKAIREERFMRNRFAEYEDYRRRTHWFVPFTV